MSEIMRASREWATRPDDERFLSLAELRNAVDLRKSESWTAAPACQDLRVLPQPGDELGVEVYDPTAGERRILTPTNHSFSQLTGYAGAPASYLRKLPAELAAINLQWGLERIAQRDTALVLAQSNGDNHLRAMTSTSYGRIWDLDVVDAVIRVNDDGRWQVPAASYATANPRRATTLYASDRDVFMFLVDPQNPVEVAGEQMFRGFMVWNSEVGAAVFGMTTFLYRYVCDNRIVWGATDIREVRIRHTSGAPERFAYEGQKFLDRYAEESTSKIAGAILAAKNADIPLNKGNGDTVEDWLKSRGFTAGAAKASVEYARGEEGGVRSVWDVINGVTAYARSIPNTNDRVEVETRAGKLLEAVAA